LPVLGTIYRAVTGDTIPEAVRVAGSMLVSGILGGPIGLAINVVTTIAEKVTGIDPEKIVEAQFHPSPSAAAQATPLAASASAAPGVAMAAAAPAPAAAASALSFKPEPAVRSAPLLASGPVAARGPAASGQLAFTPEQLAAYGVRTNAAGNLKLGNIEGADVLNTIELVRLGRAAAAYATAQTMPSMAAAHT
jgi:hypothetical protein